MAVNSRATLIEYALRKLGEPVIEINVDPDQLEDRVDEALQMYQEFHSDSMVKIYLKHLVTSDDITNGYIPIPANIPSITKLFPASSSGSAGSGMFSIKYQMALNDIANMNTYMGDLAYYEQIQQYMSILDMTLNGTPQVIFSRRQNRLYIMGDFVDGDIQAGEYIIAEAWEIIDPQVSTSIYNDMWIKKYTTAVIKRQWGANLSKFEGMQLPGGVTLNGLSIYQDAITDIDKLEEELRSTFETPIDFMVG